MQAFGSQPSLHSRSGQWTTFGDDASDIVERSTVVDEWVLERHGL
jgi:hypothetical protein